MEMNVFEEIRRILAEILDVEEKAVTPESYLSMELGAESIDLIELAAALNQRFRIEVTEEYIFLKNIRHYPWKAEKQEERSLQEVFPFLTAERLREIAANPGGPVLKVQDLVSYVTWQMTKMDS